MTGLRKVSSEQLRREYVYADPPISITQLADRHQLARKTGKYKPAVDSALEEIESLNNLVDRLLLLARPQGKIPGLRINAGKTARDIIKKMAQKAAKKQLSLHTQNIAPDVSLKCGQEHFQILLTNILDNAIKYSRPGGNIQIELNQKYLSVQVRI